jgi:hypothetical protein
MRSLRRPSVLRAAALCLLLAGLTLRGLIPLGYRPGPSDDTPLVLCSGIAGTAPIPGDMPSQASAQRCPFGLIGATPGDLAPALPAVRPVAFRLVELTLAPIAPPACPVAFSRPRPRGPPLRS